MIRNGFVGLLLFAACTPIDDKDNSPPDAPPDNEAPRVVMSIPADAATQVSPLTKITLFFDGPLDEASVTNMTFVVRAGFLSGGSGWRRIYGSVAYDNAGYKVTFAPALPLTSSSEFAVLVDGIKDLSGNTLSGAGIKFRTIFNAISRRIQYSTNGPNYWYDATFDADGHPIKGIPHSAAGPDNLWLTSDDPVACCIDTSSYTTDGRLKDRRFYDQGLDGIAGNADDRVTSRYEFTYDAMGLTTATTNYSGPGPDAQWGTSDDLISTWQKYLYDASNQNIGYQYFDNAGADGMWKTADDRCNSCTWSESTLDAFGNVTRYVDRSTGTDQIPGNADDLIQDWTELTIDPTTGAVTRYVFRSAIGPDTTWFTSDDVISNWTRYNYTAQGTDYCQYSGPGVDGTWLNSDDVGSYHFSTTFDANKQQVGQTYYDAGPDGKYCTADDVVAGRSNYTYDTYGRRIDLKGFSAGPDKVFNTTDDRVSYDYDFDLAH